MSIRLYSFILLVILLAVSVLCLFCPVIASAETPSDEFNSYHSSYHMYSVNDTQADQLVDIVQKAYDIGLLGGYVPFACGLSSWGVFVLSIAPDGLSNGTYKPGIRNISLRSNNLSVESVNGTYPGMYMHLLCSNGTFVYFSEINANITGRDFDYYVILDTATNLYRRVDAADSDIAGPISSGTTVDITLDLINGAYDHILDGYTVGGDEYDNGYDDGYQVGYGTGYDDGHGDGFSEGWIDGRDEGLEMGKDLGYREGYDDGFETGYETGYWEGWDDGYDDGYVQGELDAQPITIDIPSVITSVPQSAKSIINNTFGFELFGINVAGLLSVLLIVSIIGFVVRWLMSR